MKRLLLILVYSIPILVMAQEVERVEVLGKITAPVGEDVEEISVYNISSQMGTVTNANGEFKLRVAENDHIQITALQFKSFKLVVNATDVTSKKLLVYLNPNVNELEEVTVRSTDLTGYAALDGKNIKTSVYVLKSDLSYAALEFGYNFENDGQTDVTGNAAEEALGVNQVPVASVDLVELFKLFFPKKKRSQQEIIALQRIPVQALLNRLGHDYIEKTFGIPSDKVNDFVYFAEDGGLTRSMLEVENEIELLAYLFRQSTAYKEQLAIND